MMKCYQIELYQQCSNKCKFCYNYYTNHLQPKEFKLNSIQNAINTLKNEDFYKEYNIIALIGGEFFQGELRTHSDDLLDINLEVENKFFELMSLLKSRCIEGKLTGLWVSATLISENQSTLYRLLEMFKDVPLKDNFWILTSYDPIGRFHTEKAFDTWEKNLSFLRNNYPWVRLNCCSVLTGMFIDKCLEDTTFIKKLLNKNKFQLFIKVPTFTFKDPNTGLLMDKTLENRKWYNDNIFNNWFPTRDKAIKFMIMLKQNYLDIYEEFINIKYRSNLLIRYLETGDITEDIRNKNKRQESDHELTSSCGHVINYQCYVDSEECLLCDKAIIDNAF